MVHEEDPHRPLQPLSEKNGSSEGSLHTSALVASSRKTGLEEPCMAERPTCNTDVLNSSSFSSSAEAHIIAGHGKTCHFLTDSPKSQLHGRFRAIEEFWLYPNSWRTGKEVEARRWERFMGEGKTSQAELVDN